jgi:hypothetical protein
MLLVTTLSVVIAAISSVFALRLLRIERLRSAARVATLEAAIDGHAGGDDFAWEVPAPEPPPAPPMFEPTSRHHGPLLTAAVSLVAGVVIVVLMAMLADRDHAVVPPAVPTTTEATAHQPLELLAMSHSRQGTSVVVTGVVRNPSSTATAPMTTEITALDRDGLPIGSATVPMTSIAPGASAPFTVRFDHIGSLGRYRVSFKTGSGIAPHVDRRGTTAAGITTE